MSQQKFTPPKEIIIPTGRANRFSFLLFLIAAVMFGIPFSLIWGSEAFFNGLKVFFSDFLILIPALIGGMILHELIHAITFVSLSGLPFSAISFGMNWRQLAPYVHCKEALTVKHYRMGILLPMIVTGICPAIFAATTGNGWLMCLSLVLTAGGAGDILAWNALRQFSANQRVCDHPDHLGFTIMNS